MRLGKITAMAAILPLIAGIGGAEAAMLDGEELKKRISGSTIRGDFRTLRGYQQHVWEFKADGTVQTDYRLATGTGRAKHESATDQGRWWVDGDVLCVNFNRVFFGAPTCFNVEAKADNGIELTGRVSFEGTIKPSN